MNRVELVLECGHSVRVVVTEVRMFDPYPCHFDGLQYPREVHNEERRAVCYTCRYGRWCGQSEATANRYVTRHSRRNPSHVTAAVYDTVTLGGTGKAFENTPRNYLRLVANSDSLFADIEPTSGSAS